MIKFYTITGWIILIGAISGAVSGGDEVVATFGFAMMAFMFAELGEIKELLTGGDI